MSSIDKSIFVLFSDNCGQLYKSRSPLHHIRELSLKFQIERCFFGERYDKNECDAVGGVVKSFLSHFAACERASLATANKIVDFLSSTFELTHKSTMLLGE